MTNPGGAADGLVVAYVPGVTLTKWRGVWRERLPRVPLETLEVAEADVRRLLDAAGADLCFARLPVDTTGLHAIRLWDETPVAWVAKDHPIALFDEVTLAELAGETVLDAVDDASLARVAAGDAVLRVPQAIARSHSRRDLAHRPIRDAEPTTIALLWRADNDNPLIDEFIGIVRGRTATSARTAQERAGQTAGGERPAGHGRAAGPGKPAGRHRAVEGPKPGGRRPSPPPRGRRGH